MRPGVPGGQRMSVIALHHNDWRSILQRARMLLMQQYGIGQAIVADRAMVIGARQKSAGAATIVNCTFTAANGTLLTAYPWTDPADVRPGSNQWFISVMPGSPGLQVLSNRAQFTITSGSRNAIQTSVSDCTISGDAHLDSTAHIVDIFARWTNTTNFWMLYFSPTMVIFECTAGIFTNRASVSGIVVGDYTLTVVLSGTSISFSAVGPVTRSLSYTSSVHQTDTIHGISTRNSGSYFDNFKVTVP